MRLEQLRNALRALLEKRDAERKELLGLTEVDKLDEKQEARYKELSPRFSADNDGKPVWADDEQVRSLKAEIASLEAVLAGFERGNTEPGAAPTFKRQQPDPLKDEGVQYGPIDQVRGAARTAIEKLPFASDSVRQGLTLTLERADDRSGKLSRHMIAASRPEYRSAWVKLMQGLAHEITPEEARAVSHVRAASLTDSLGGYAVPTVTDVSLIIGGAHDGMTPNTIRQLANVRQITGDNLNVTKTDGVSASYVAAQTEATDGSPTLERITITPHKAHVFCPFDVEIQGDWPAMEAEIGRLMAVAKDDLELVKFTTGTGTNEPWGLFYDIYTTYTGQVQASATGNTFAAADVYALVQQVAQRWRYRGVFLANEITYDTMRGFASHAGANLFNESISVDRPATVLGRPAYGHAAIDATYGSGENYIMGFGDVREAYTIVDRVGMTTEFVPHLFGGTNNYPVGMRGIYAWWRNGAAVVNDDAFAVLNIT